MTKAEGFDALLEAAAGPAASEERIADLARTALAQGDEERALPVVEGQARSMRSAHCWQWAAMLHRATDDREAALRALAEAEALDPRDPQIARSKARILLEAGLPAVESFAAAVQQTPNDSDLLLGLVAALFAQNDPASAIAGLENMLSRQPAWIAGHRDLAQLYCLTGQRDRLAESAEIALQRLPDNEALWSLLIDLHAQAEQFESMREAARRAQSSIGVSPSFRLSEAAALSETGDGKPADDLFSQLDTSGHADTALHYVRHLMRQGRMEAALPIIEKWIEDDSRSGFWPYASIAWRAVGDPRSQWLDGDFVRCVDLSDRLPDMDLLAAHLRGLHMARERHLDQSVRGGTQTDGALFSRVEPIVKSLRAAVCEAVSDYIAALPPADPRHPLLSYRRDRAPRFAGSWSVRLTGAGFHSNHVHPAGWISSALYVCVPSTDERGEADAGCLQIGQPQAELNVALPPLQIVEPVAARLVLFPSTMWHGTRPFDAGERMTVAFDVAPPLSA